jgi:hypothetical protein
MINFNPFKLLLYTTGTVVLFRILLTQVKHTRLVWYITGIGFLLNLLWEMAQMPLYTQYHTFADHIVCIPASVGDVLLILILYTIVSFSFDDWNWIRALTKRNTFLLVLLGMLIAIVMEQRALSLGLWGYTIHMPLLPLVHVGLLPVLQMMILPLSTFYISNLYFLKINSTDKSY